MHAAQLSSPRLQRVLKVLRDGKWHTTRKIVRRANVCAVNACIAELRHHGAEIACVRRKVGGKWRFSYRMMKEPEA